MFRLVQKHGVREMLYEEVIDSAAMELSRLLEEDVEERDLIEGLRRIEAILFLVPTVSCNYLFCHYISVTWVL